MSATHPRSDNSTRLYEQVADCVTELIEKGTLRPGQRIPSIRRTSRQHRVSISTVIDAYRLLEDRGLVEVRPQSGYYVRLRERRRLPQGEVPPEVATRRLPLEPSSVRCCDLVRRFLEASRRRDVLPLGAAVPSPEFLPTEALGQALRRAVRHQPESAAQYCLSPGLESLRREIARRGIEAGVALGPDDVVITSGATEALMLALRAVTQPGDTVAVESPTYYGMLQLFEALNLKVVEVCTNPRSGISLESLGELLNRGEAIRALVVIPNVHNPLGGVMPDEKKQQLTDLLGPRGIPIIEDDTYGELVFDQQRPKSLLALDRHQNVIQCASFSKTLAPGYRVGWVVPGRWYDTVHRLKLVCSLASATPTQMAVAQFLIRGGYDRHVRRLRRAYAQQVAYMADAVCRSFPEGTRATRPLGGHILWVELPEGSDSLRLCDEALARGISVTPGPMFSATMRFGNCIRLNCAVPWNETVERAVQTLGQLARAARTDPPCAPTY